VNSAIPSVTVNLLIYHFRLSAIPTNPATQRIPVTANPVLQA
jgi:hypothetical protein